MAKIFEPTREQVEGWQEFVAGLPDDEREVCERFFPWELYRLKNTGQRVVIRSVYVDRETMTTCFRVRVSGQFNAVMFETEVFGINPDDLKPCELPGVDEVLGTVLTDQDEIDRHINEVRPHVLASRN